MRALCFCRVFFLCLLEEFGSVKNRDDSVISDINDGDRLLRMILPGGVGLLNVR